MPQELLDPPAPDTAVDRPAAHNLSTPPTTRLRRLVADRLTGQPVWLLVTQLFIGLGWGRAAVEKLISGDWWEGETLEEFLDLHAGDAIGWWQPVLDLVVEPHLIVVSLVVLGAQLLVAASLLLDRARAVGLALGMGMNLAFVASGAVNPSAFYLLAQGAIVLWAIEARPAAVAARIWTLVSVVGTALAAAGLPWIRALSPHDVVDDPGAMFATLGLLAVVGAETAGRQLREKSLGSESLGEGRGGGTLVRPGSSVRRP